MLTLFRGATLEDWTDIMYTNMHGCDQYGYDGLGVEDLCQAPKGSGILAMIFFVIFTVIGALVLMTLFIGVVTTSMEEASADQQERAEVMERVREFQSKEGLDDEQIDLYETVFHMLDLDGGGTIEEEELRIGLQSIGKNPTDDELKEMMLSVDEDGSGEIDFAEFVEFMFNLKQQNAGKADDDPNSGMARRSSFLDEAISQNTSDLLLRLEANKVVRF